MTFQPESVNYAVKKLEELRDAIVASLQDEEVQEEEAVVAFINLVNELEAFQTQA